MKFINWLLCLVFKHDYRMDREERGVPTDVRYEVCKRCGHTRGTL